MKDESLEDNRNNLLEKHENKAIAELASESRPTVLKTYMVPVAKKSLRDTKPSLFKNCGARYIDDKMRLSSNLIEKYNEFSMKYIRQEYFERFRRGSGNLWADQQYRKYAGLPPHRRHVPKGLTRSMSKLQLENRPSGLGVLWACPPDAGGVLSAQNNAILAS